MILTLAALTSNAVPAEQVNSALALLWLGITVAVAVLIWPKGLGRRRLRQVVAISRLAVREGLRMKIFWTVFGLALIPGLLAFFSDADGTHVGRARLILDSCLSTGEVLGAGLIVLLASLSLSREIESRVLYTFGTKPIPRWTILAGKALGFWSIGLLFLAALLMLCGILVRAVPLRAETRTASVAETSGTWDALRREALVTRQFQSADGLADSGKFRSIKAGETREWLFTVGGQPPAADAYALRMKLGTTQAFSAQVKDLRVHISDKAQRVLFDKQMSVPIEVPFQIFLNPQDIAAAEVLSVKLSAAPAEGAKTPPRVIIPPDGMLLGAAADGFAMNLFKAFLLMAVQGWILAVITSAWSGVLSFPVTVALGVFLVLGGEMSRLALELLQNTAARAQDLGGAPASLDNPSLVWIRYMLLLVPDFHAAGGPAGFVESNHLSGWAVAHAAFTMGVLRGFGWALPGAIFFHSREVGS